MFIDEQLGGNLSIAILHYFQVINGERLAPTKYLSRTFESFVSKKKKKKCTDDGHQRCD